MREFVSPDKDMSKVGSTVYELYGIVNHSGTISGGHYTAYEIYLIRECKVSENKWYDFNDSYATQIDLERKKYDVYGSSSPYLLFYKLK